MKREPAWVCFDCGNTYGRGMPPGHVCTTHEGVCGICGETKSVTEPRDFGHLVPGWEQQVKKVLIKEGTWKV